MTEVLRKFAILRVVDVVDGQQILGSSSGVAKHEMLTVRIRMMLPIAQRTFNCVLPSHGKIAGSGA